MDVARQMSKCMKRWYPLIPHPEQLRLISDTNRLKAIAAGRRSGKTERAKRYMAKKAMRHGDSNFFIAAPTYDQVTKIYWDDMKLLTFVDALTGHTANKNDSQMKFPNGTTIHFIGLDRPERIEGIRWQGGLIDEIASIKEEAWTEHIYPALCTFDPTDPDFRPWCWLLGVPDGFNHFYDICEMAKSGEDPDWTYYHWVSADILPKDVVESARRTLSAREFRQEFEASFETVKGRIYDEYSHKNLTKEEIQPHEQLLWMHDFNYTPLSSAIGVIRDDKLYILDEILLESAVARQTAEEFTARYANHQNKILKLFGDPAGRAGEKHGHASDYTDLTDILRSHGWQVQRFVKAKAPAIRDRQNAVRAKIKSAQGEVSLFVNKTKCPHAHKGLATTQLKKGSASYIEEESYNQHITTAIGYCIDYLYPIVYTNDNHYDDDLNSIKTVNYWNRSKKSANLPYTNSSRYR